MSVLGVLIVIASSAAAGALLERMFVALNAGDKHDDKVRHKESEAEERRGEEKSAEASVAKEKAAGEQELALQERASALAPLNTVKDIVDTGSIAEAVMNRLRDKGISIPRTSSATALTEAAVQAMVEEVAKRLFESLGLLVQVHTGEMTKAELETKHPRTASAINSVSESFKKRGLTSGSSVQDVVNTVVNGASGISGVEQRAIAEGQSADTAPTTNAATPVVGAANTNIAAADTAASAEKVVEDVEKASEAGAKASCSGAPVVTIGDVSDDDAQPPAKNANAETINTGEGSTQPSTSVVDPTLAGGGGTVPHSADSTIACFEAPVSIAGVNSVSL
ncbi:hypothetical protein DOS86_01905 [Anaplasma marginale]|uniref:hypothetical protein n=1 Tax=Anaplasma marginale TaxID=770 RepID=UPI000DEF3F97|nr:hypothetical protein [Anaplasma marginale]RCL19961.1 hypothetical protein DOS86_01905 [Anaplasma marginale]